MMGVGRFVSALALVALASASIGDNSIDGGDRVVLVAPVLGPHDITQSRQFPILAPRNPSANVREHEAKSLEGSQQPIYVQKLEDQEVPSSGRYRQKRCLAVLYKLFPWLGGGYGGGGGFGGGGGSGGGGGGYGGGNGGGGGGSGGSDGGDSGKPGQDGGDSGNSGQDGGDSGNSGQDGGDSGNSGQDGGDSGNSGQLMRLFKSFLIN